MSAAFITGGAKRVGRVVALKLAREGFDIALHYNSSFADAGGVQKEIEAIGRRCVLFNSDFKELSGIEKLIIEVKKEFPELSVLINNASVFDRAEFLETTEEVLDSQFNINFKAPFFLTQAFAKQAASGQVINILDTDIVKYNGSHFAYLLSKKMLAEFTKMAALALGNKIVVNGICPGIVLTSPDHDEQYMCKVANKLPLKINPLPEHIADAVFSLLNMQGVTGQLLYVDGGQNLI